MKGFLQLTEQQNNGGTLYINPLNIATIRGSTNATIYMVNGQHFTVQQSVQEVSNLFNGLTQNEQAHHKAA